MTTLYCFFCHEKNQETVSHCTHCGASLLPESKPIGMPEAVSPPGLPDDGRLDEFVQRLPYRTLALFTAGRHDPILLANMQTMVLGRDIPQGSVEVLDLSGLGEAAISASRRHALLSATPGGYTISDLGSTNGTWLNHEHLQPGKAYPLQNKDEIKLGSLVMIICFQPIYTAVFTGTLMLTQRNTLLKGGHTLRPHFILAHLSPYLQALNELQQIVGDCRQEAVGDLTIHQIAEQENGISVSLDIEKTTVQLISDQITPWRDQYLQFSGLNQQEQPDIQKLLDQLSAHVLREISPGKHPSPVVEDRLRDALLILMTSQLEAMFRVETAEKPIHK